jgi:hypothetical protein
LVKHGTTFREHGGVRPRGFAKCGFSPVRASTNDRRWPISMAMTDDKQLSEPATDSPPATAGRTDSQLGYETPAILEGDHALDGHKLAGDLNALLDHAKGQSITFREMLDVLGERATAIMLLLLAAPFIVIPIPGFSTLPGLVMAALGLSVMLSMKPWLPGFIARRHISNSILTKLVHGTTRVLGKVEKLFHPRMDFMLHKVFHLLTGLSLITAAVALALPIPIPWNNGPPAICIVILALGILERDGLMILIGIVYNLVMWIVLIAAGGLILKAIAEVWQKVAPMLGM